MTRIISPNMKWPDSCQPVHQVFDLIDEVQTLHKQNDTGAVIVVDRYEAFQDLYKVGVLALTSDCFTLYQIKIF